MGLSAAVYAAFARSGAAALLRTRDAAPVFCFHNVVPSQLAGRHGDQSLHLAAPAFNDIVEWIRHHFRVIPVTEVCQRLSQGRSVRGVASLTFDDAYQGALQHAFPLLRTLGLPATVFIVCDAAERPRPFWWDTVGPLEDDQRLRYLLELAGDGERIPTGGDALPAEYLPADWTSLRAACDELIQPGSHTISHRNLSALDPVSLGRELRESRARLSEAFQRAVDVISYPYGFATRAVVAASAREGYRAGLTLGFGRARGSHHPHALPRINIPAKLDFSAFESWSSGVRLRAAPVRLSHDGMETIPSGAT